MICVKFGINKLNPGTRKLGVMPGRLARSMVTVSGVLCAEDMYQVCDGWNLEECACTSPRYPDRINFYLPEPLVVSERFAEAYKQSGLQGIKDFLPIETA